MTRGIATVALAVAALVGLPRAGPEAQPIRVSVARGAWQVFPPAGDEGVFTDIVTGPDGAVWLSEPARGLVRVDQAGRRTDYTITVTVNAIAARFLPRRIVWSGQRLYATGCELNQCYGVAIFTPGQKATFVSSEFSNESTVPAGIAAAPDGSAWVAEESHLAHILPNGTEVDHNYDTGEKDNLFSGIAITRDGSIWFTEFDRDAIARYYPGTGATVEYPLQAQGITCLLAGLTADSGNTVYAGCGTGFVMLRPDGVAELFTTGYQSSAGPRDVSYGPGAFLWVSALDTLERFDPARHSAALYAAPIGQDALYGSTTGPDGKLWILSEGGAIYRFSPQRTP